MSGFAGRFRAGLLLACLVSAFAAAQETQDVSASLKSLPCLTAASTDCRVPAADLKRARALFDKGAKLKAAGNSPEAFDLFERASKLVPRNVEYATAREMTRQALVYQHMSRGNELLLADKRVEALAEFRAAAELDPKNEFALQRMRDALGDVAPQLSPALRRVEESREIEIAPLPGKHDFHVRGDARTLYNSVVAAYGMSAEFDPSVEPRRVRFDLGNADFLTAISAAERATKTFTTPMDAKRLLVVPDTAENRQKFERVSMQTYYITDATAPTQLNDLVNVLRTIFELKLVTMSANNSSITVRGPQRILDASARFIDEMQQGAPQVLLDVKVYEISHTALRTLGIDLPLQFQMFNLSSAAIAAALGAGGSDLINQLISSGAINQANSQALQALIGQLHNQQNSIFSTPFATFGGGITRFAVGIPAATAHFSLNASDLRSLEHLTVRASQNNLATMMIGTRYPILNATFAPIFNSAALSQVIGNNSFIAPFPSFNYQDLGVTLKATPQIHRDDDVSLKLELQIQALGTQSFNGVPVISNRQYQGTITVKDGEAAVLAGVLTSQDLNTLRGIPGISLVPVLGRVGSSEQKQLTDSELLVTITPHVLNAAARERPEMVLQR